MPRLLQRLTDKLTVNARLWQKEKRVPHRASGRWRPRSLLSPAPPPPSWSPFGRTQSIVLDEFNPLIHRKAYAIHKSLPPLLHVDPRRKNVKNEYDRPRVMTEQERAWWSSPYLRMLTSPVRICFMTSRYLPSSFMIRMAPFRIPSQHDTQPVQSTFLPDGLEHPKFRGRRSASGCYVVCWKPVVENISKLGRHKRFSPGASVHSLISAQIGHLLRLRILQELEILVETLKRRPRGPNKTPILRRLTRAEFKKIKETNVIPYCDAVAVLVVPPVNKDPATGQRPEPASTLDNSPPKDEDRGQPTRPLPPLSELLPTCAPDHEDEGDAHPFSLFSPSKVPLYNGLALFPSRSQRAAFHKLLCQLLNIETRVRSPPDRDSSSASDVLDGREFKRAEGDEKSSHAFLLCSSADTVLRGDAVDAAIALLRLRMWEGTGWHEGTEQNGGWLWEAYRRNV